MKKTRAKGWRSSWVLPFLGPLVFGALLFSYTVEARKPWFGVLGMGHHQWNTAKSMIFTDNWLREGPWNLGFGLFQNPGSIEFLTLESREVYPPYPPGAIVPLYGLAQLAGSEATPGLVMGYNLACHFLIALFLGWTLLVFLLSLGMRGSEAGLFSLVPILAELLLPGPLYFHQNVYFVDQAVLLPFVLALFLEVLRDQGWEGKRGRALAWAQGMKEVGSFIRRNAEFKDVVFSPVSEVPMVPRSFSPIRIRGSIGSVPGRSLGGGHGACRREAGWRCSSRRIVTPSPGKNRRPCPLIPVRRGACSSSRSLWLPFGELPLDIGSLAPIILPGRHL